MVFGRVAVLTDPVEARAALTGLIARYFPALREGEDYRPITDKELGATSVYALGHRALERQGELAGGGGAAGRTGSRWPGPAPGSAPSCHA